MHDAPAEGHFTPTCSCKEFASTGHCKHLPPPMPLPSEDSAWASPTGGPGAAPPSSKDRDGANQRLDGAAPVVAEPSLDVVPLDGADRLPPLFEQLPVVDKAVVVGELLGKGSSGCSVHRATLGGAPCVAKVLPVAFAHQHLERFAAELQALAHLPPHAHVLGYLGYHRVEVGDAELAARDGGRAGGMVGFGSCGAPASAGNTTEHRILMEYAGQSLRDLIDARARSAAGPFPVATAAQYALQVARGLCHCHRHHVWHRDLKSENVLAAGGVLKVADFNLAARARPSETRTSIVGSPFYMSPEVYRGAAYDGSTDVWSFGMLLFELMDLRRPYGEDLLMSELEDRVLSGALPPFTRDGGPPPAFAPLVDLMARCLAMEAAARPGMEAVVQDLEAMCSSPGLRR